jgi:conjugative transfer pilus assembly protein TraH
VRNPSDTNSAYSANYIPPCDGNQDYESFLTGGAQGRDATGAACTTITDTNANLMNFVGTNMTSIANKIQSKTALLPTETAFLQATPMSISLILKNAVATNTTQQIIGKLSDITAKAFAYYMLADLSGRTMQLQQLAQHVRSAQKENKAGSSPESCQMSLFEGGMSLVDQLAENTHQLMSESQMVYANVTQEMNAIEMTMQNMKHFDDTVFDEVARRFGKGVALRATGQV